MNETLIFDIKRYAINDGPGIRITIFIKGCPLSCAWCHNPESISPVKQKLYSLSKCISCNLCVEACTQNACTLGPKGITTNTETCLLCGNCAEVCPTKATEITGMEMSIDEIMTVIKKETLLIDQSEGGVTFSGGEPLMHHKFLIELLDRCKKEEIHTCIDTTGFTSKEVLLEVAKRADYFLYDIKVMDSNIHKDYTDVHNEKILSNLKLLASTGANISIRIPLIKGVNDDNDNIHKTAYFISQLEGKKKQVNVLPYHRVARKKYEKLGVKYDERGMDIPSEERLLEIDSIFKEYKINIIIGG